jgi:hypothetical protein
MTARDEIIAYLGLPAGSTFLEIEQAYLQRRDSASERLATGDESARVELAVLEEAYGRLTGRRSGQREAGSSVRSTDIAADMPDEVHLRSPVWWECYLGFLLSIASVAAFVALIADLPHVYRKGGFLIPLGLIALSLLLSIFATMFSEAEFRQDRRAHVLEKRGFESGRETVRLRYYVSGIATLLSRTMRWLLGPALLVTLFLNFASLKGHYY